MNAAASHALPVRVYLVVFASLMALLVATLVAAMLPLGAVLGSAVALTIAIAKAALVVLYFMHVRHGTRLTWVWAGLGFFWLLIMFGITLGDYVARSWAPVRGW